MEKKEICLYEVKVDFLDTMLNIPLSMKFDLKDMPTTNIPILECFIREVSRNKQTLEGMINIYPKLLKHPAYSEYNMNKIFLQIDKDYTMIIVIDYIKPYILSYYE